MGKTLLELFENKDSFKYGTVYSEVKEDKETLIEQETSGVRIRSAVELNNPLIYGNEAMRIANRSTPDLEKMKQGTGGTEGDGGLIGKGLGKLTGGKLTSIGDVRDKVNTTLGIPVNQIPTRVIEDIKDQDSQTPVVPGKNGTEVGKLLKESAGNPKTILKQGAGKLIGKAKDKLRGALFGSPDTIGSANGDEPNVVFTTNVKGETYSDTKDGYKSSDISKGDLEGTKLDLKLVSPLYGVKRKESDGRFGKSEYGFINNKNANGVQALYSPDSSLDGKLGGRYLSQRTNQMESKYGLGTGDSINLLSPGEEYELDENQAFAKVGDKVLEDFIPIWIKKIGQVKPVMFRALISGLTETVSPSWNTSKFVGNPYNFYTFESIERSTSFNLKLYCNNSIELANNWERITKITQMTYPSIGAQFANAPIIQFRIGDIYKNKIGFIESLTYTIPDDSNWETDGASGYLPKIVDVAITIKFIESVGAEDRPYGYTISEAAAEAINEKRQANSDIAASRTQSDGSIKQDEPVKVTSKGLSKLEISKPSAPKIPLNLGNKKKTATPSDAESAKLPDNANQSGISDKLDGKTPSQAIKEAESKNNITTAQATVITTYKGVADKVEVIGESQLPKDVFIPFYQKPINSIYVKASDNDGYEQIVQVSPTGRKLMVYQKEV
jgi:hypothetical protein